MIANALNQTSPLRRRITNEALSVGRGPSVNEVEPSPYPSRITQVTIISLTIIDFAFSGAQRAEELGSENAKRQERLGDSTAAV